jgi:sulfite oxidase
MRVDPYPFPLSRRTFLKGTAAGLLASSAAWLRPERLHGREIGKQLNIHTEAPMNAEPFLGALVEDWITPLELFYVRSHGALPELDERQFRLRVEGLVEEPLTLSLAELKERFEAASAVATLTCAGNRRSEFNPPKAEGVQWEPGAIGNARWKGAKLSDVLKKAKLKEGAKHVWFEGLDQIDHKGEQIHFGGSIPLDRAMQDRGSAPGTILAWDMNEQPLEPHHGFPLRTVVPGYIGARSVKWLGKVVVSDRPSPNHFLQGAYKLVTETSEAAFERAEPLYEYRLNAAICEPAADMELKSGRATVRGYALAPGDPERSVAKVEVSADGGRSWTPAELTSDTADFAWGLWNARVQVSPATKHLIARATDSSGQTMPESVPWNAKGYMYNGWHKLPVKVS